MVKTFREVMAEIKVNEVWESDYKIIECYVDGIKICHKEKTKMSPAMFLSDKDNYKLKRSQYTFTEAFAEYEKGAEIESVVTGNKYKNIDGVEMCCIYKIDLDFYYSKDGIEVTEIKGKWYINR